MKNYSRFFCMRNCLLIALLLATVFLSGCEDVDTNNDDETFIVSKDLLKISDKDGFYATVEEVGVGRTFRIYMSVENVGNQDVDLIVGESAEDEKVGGSLLYNYNRLLYSLEKFSMYPSKTSWVKTVEYPEGDVYYHIVSVSPNNPQGFKWAIKAPEDEDFTQIMNRGTFKFHLEYFANATTNRELTFLNSVEANQRAFTGDTLRVHENNIASPGPVVIDFKVPEGEPIESDSADPTDSFDITLILTNVGEGLVKIDRGALRLKASKNIPYAGAGFCDLKMDTAASLKDAQYDIYFFDRPIEFYADYGDERIFCSFMKPSVDFVDTYMFTAETEYTYTTEPREVEIVTLKKEAR